MSSNSIYSNTYIQQIQFISLPNKYTKWYCQIIYQAQQRAASKKEAKLVIGVAIEKHHVLPKCFALGGEKDKINYAYLTPREHFICHWLLTKMLLGELKAKMIYALNGMKRINNFQYRYQTKITARVYEKLKISVSTLLKARKFSEEHLSNLRKSAKIRADNESFEIKERRSKLLSELNHRRKGIKKPNMKGSNNPMSKLGVKEKQNNSFIKKYGVSNPSLVPYTCEYCGKSGQGIAGYKRWHGQNCKSINTE